MTRAFKELQGANIGQVIKQGKESRWYFKEGRQALWQQAKPFLRSPIKNRTWLTQKYQLTIAGLSALSYCSDLNEPLLPVFSISRVQWKALIKSGAKEVPSSEGAIIELEIWHYNPNLFAKNGLVDPFSLYLSLKESKDERIEAALEKMMERIE